MKRPHLVIGLLLLGVFAMYQFSGWSIPAAGRRFAELFHKSEYTHGLPTHLLARLAQQESNYDPEVVSAAGAQGIMQLTPRWHPTVDPFNVSAAIDYAGALLRKHFDRFGTWQKALAAYNAGPTRLQREIRANGYNWLANMPQETQAYIARITSDVRVS